MTSFFSSSVSVELPGAKQVLKRTWFDLEPKKILIELLEKKGNRLESKHK